MPLKLDALNIRDLAAVANLTLIKIHMDNSSAVSIFQFGFNDVRVVLICGEPWLVAKDVCDVLGLGNSRQVCERLDGDERSVTNVDTTSGLREVTIINESGFYRLVMTSRKPSVKKFQKWITSEVIPSIRKTGSYTVSKQQNQLPPDRCAIEYIQASKTLQDLSNPILKSLLEQRLMEELTPTSKLISCASESIKIILTVRAQELGYKSSQIGSGSSLGKFVLKQGIAPIGKVQHGKYPVNVYDLTTELDRSIHNYFS